MPKTDPLTIGQLTRYIERKFTADPYLNARTLWVVGELTDYRPNSYHQYFALKDDTAADHDQTKIKAVMFHSAFSKVRFKLENGQKVLARGRVSVYPARGEYQLYVDQLEAVGTGSLQVAFEQLYKKLKKEGLFDRPKRPIPPFPKRVAIVTSNDAAVKHDLITTFRRRNSLIQLVFYPTKVQGETAAPQIARQIERAGQGDYDALIVARGGGSRGDLWAFNEEVVGRAIAAAPLPVISSVGHETDTTIADLAADAREATPTAAAVRASAWLLTDVLANLQAARAALVHALQEGLARQQQRLTALKAAYPLAQPDRLLAQPSQRVDELRHRLVTGEDLLLRQQAARLQHLSDQLAGLGPQEQLRRQASQLAHDRAALGQAYRLTLAQRQQKLARLIGQLDSLSPLKVLKRGYAYATQDGQVVSAANLAPGAALNLHFYDGKAVVTVDKVEKGD